MRLKIFLRPGEIFTDFPDKSFLYSYLHTGSYSYSPAPEYGHLSKNTGVYFRMKSDVHHLGPTFELLQQRLIEFVNTRIRNGEFSERALARMLGVSQPQLHNVLKGARKLNISLADAFLSRLQISMADLLRSAQAAVTEPGTHSGDCAAARESVVRGFIQAAIPSSISSPPNDTAAEPSWLHRKKPSSVTSSRSRRLAF